MFCLAARNSQLLECATRAFSTCMAESKKRSKRTAISIEKSQQKKDILSVFSPVVVDLFGPFLGHFWHFLGPFFCPFVSLWDVFGIVLASFWGCFGHFPTIFKSKKVCWNPKTLFWPYFKTLLKAILGPFWEHRTILGWFWGVFDPFLDRSGVI